MLLLAILLFAIAALIGFYLLTFILQNKETPKGVVFIHGPLAALGLVLLIIYTIFYSPRPVLSTIVLVFAALGGMYMIYRDLTGKSVPKVLALGHGALALIGFFLLILFTF